MTLNYRKYAALYREQMMISTGHVTKDPPHPAIRGPAVTTPVAMVCRVLNKCFPSFFATLSASSDLVINSYAKYSDKLVNKTS